MRSRRVFASCSLAVLLLLLTGAEPAAAADRPNIIFIMSDDHASQAVGAYGSRVNQTPNIDRLAREGMTFGSMFVTNSICTPSRAAILTGQYAHVNGVPVFNRFDSTRSNVAKLLQAGGYYTAMIGKWHLGSDPSGFDRWEILPGQGAYFNPLLYTAAGEKTYQGYVTDIVTDLAVDTIDKRPKDRPFFLMLHHKAPHRPWQPDEKHKAQFADRWIPEPPTLYDRYETRADALRQNAQRVFADLTRNDLKLTPPEGLGEAEMAKWLSTKPTEVTVNVGGQQKTLTGEALDRWKYQRYMRDYLACIQAVDDNVGRLLDYLHTSGLEKNTLVVYASDQGFFLGEHGLYDKRFMYEESLRMPFLVRWPASIAAGARTDAISLNVDIAPTFLELAGLAVPADIQGRSLVSVMRGTPPADWRASMYYRYYHDPGDHNTRAHYGVRTKTHKLIYYWTLDQWELFDLRTDPLELHNLYGQPGFDAITGDLKAEMQRLKTSLGDTDQLAKEQLPNGVDGPPARLRGR